MDLTDLASASAPPGKVSHVQTCGRLLAMRRCTCIIGHSPQRGGHPRQIHRSEGSQEVTAIQCAQMKRQRKVIYESRPQRGCNCERCRLRDRQLLQRKQRLWRQRQRPDFLQVSMRQPEQLQPCAAEPLARSLLSPSSRWNSASPYCWPARPLPEGCLRFDVSKDTACHTHEQSVEVGCSRCRWRPCVWITWRTLNAAAAASATGHNSASDCDAV